MPKSWQPEQVSPLTASDAPLMCLPPATLMVPSAFTVPAWQEAQALESEATSGGPLWAVVSGGKSWQLLHVAAAPFQAGLIVVPW